MTVATMVHSVTSVLNEADEFQATMRTEAEASAVITGRAHFKARMTKVALRHLRILTVEEELPRIAFIKVPEDSVLIAFLIGDQASQIWGGIKAQPHAIITVRPGQGVHARTDGPCHWGAIWFPTEEFARYRTAVTGKPSLLPGAVCLWRPALSLTGRLRHLHLAAVRAARSRWEPLTMSDAAHGLEQQLIHALVECLDTDQVDAGTTTTSAQQNLMVRFENLMKSRPEGDLDQAEICAALGVSDRTLRRSCELQLGVSPMAYLRLLRMQSARRALRHGVRETLRISEVAGRYGFRSPSRFAGAYRDLFGELPSATLRRGLRREPRIIGARRQAAGRGTPGAD